MSESSPRPERLVSSRDKFGTITYRLIHLSKKNALHSKLSTRAYTPSAKLYSFQNSYICIHLGKNHKTTKPQHPTPATSPAKPYDLKTPTPPPLKTMTDISHLSNRATKRESIKSSKQRRKPNASTLRQRRIERERDARQRTAEMIEKRGTSGNAEQQGLFASVVRYIEQNVCGWYVPVVGALVGVVIGSLLRMLW